jgi:ribA/ribD-fused uncharacterized protein
MTIKFYGLKNSYGYMSNFYSATMFLWGRWWRNVEAPFQAKKADNESEYEEIWLAPTAREAKILGRKVKMRPDWESIKYDIMMECVLTKFLHNKDLLKQLLLTEDEELIEDSPSDYVWGCGSDGSGKNYLGKILMEVRSLLRNPNF